MAFLSLQIKPNDEWLTAVISPDSSVSIEIISPIFDIDAGGGFSYPFTLNVEANQHLFPTLTNNHGAHVYDLIYHKPFRLYAGGVPLFHGIVDMDDEVEIETQDDGTHTVAINLASDNQELSALLEGVNCQDVPVKDRIPVGTEFNSFSLSLRYKNDVHDKTYGRIIKRVPLPAYTFSTNKYEDFSSGSLQWVNTTNVSEPYPTKAYCNTRICIQKREKDKDGNYQTLREYEVFEADRANSGICFYVMYFLDCLFAHFGIRYDNSNLKAFEDMNRIAFFTTKCECDTMSTPYTRTARSDDGEVALLHDVIKAGAYVEAPNKFQIEVSAASRVKYANSKNFPNMEVSSIIEDIQNAFGIRFLFSSYESSCRAIFLKDIFADRNPIVSSGIIHSAEQTDVNVTGVKMTFGVDDEEDTNYNYSPKTDNSMVVIRDNYSKIKGEKGEFDRNTYYDRDTGNMFRIKVEEDASKLEELYPSLFEVGQFCDASIGEISDESKTKEISVGFTPVTCNIIEYTDTDGDSSTTSQSTGESTECKYAIFVDVEMNEPETVTLKIPYVDYTEKGGAGEAKLQFQARTGYANLQIMKELGEKYFWNRDELKKARLSYFNLAYNPQFEESPLETYDAGYTLGVMRGPGNEAGVEIVKKDYDGNGNSQWAFVPKSYAFTADSIDHFGKIFDYNGKEEGGTSLYGRVSLKLQGEKKVTGGIKVEDKSVVVSTARDAAYWISVLFPGSNADLLNLRLVFAYELYRYGWTDAGQGNEVIPIYLHKMYVDGEYRLYNVITQSGTVLTPDELADYGFGELEGSEDNDPLRICIKTSTESIPQKEIDDLKALINLYYFPDTAEPYTLTDIPDAVLNDSYYPINSVNAHRGLFHKFNYEYAYFLTHARIVRLTTTMSLAELSSLDLIKWHTFGQYTGLIKQVSCDLDNERGLSDVIIELYYL